MIRISSSMLASNLLNTKYRIKKVRACGWMISVELRFSPRKSGKRIAEADYGIDSHQE
jgi:hypothetical protein